MWENILLVNSILWCIAAGFLVYAVGASVFFLSYRPLEVAFIIFMILSGTETILAFITD